MRRLRRIIDLVALLGLAAVSMRAQSSAPTGVIQGTVQDSSGAPIAGARITATRIHSGTVRTGETDDTGQFRFAGLAIGEYNLRVQQDGFTTVEIKLLQLSIGQILTQRIDLRPAEVIEKLEVREQTDALDPEATSASSALGGERIEESPAQNRSFLNFVLVAPGVASSAGSNSQRSGAGTRSPQSDSGFSFAGMRSRNNSLLIDGVDNRDETTGGNRVAIGLEMVQEFRVSGTSMSAESGGAAGGSVNMVTRSGTNLWHGDFTYFTQNERFNARNPEALSTEMPRYRRYQPGFSVGGPILRDRTFFFGGFEQEWESSQEWSDSPGSLIDRINAALTTPAFGRAAVHSIHRGLYPAKAAQSESSIKVNHQLGMANTFAVRYAFSRGTDHKDVQDTENFTDESVRGTSLTRDQSVVGSWISLLSPHLVNDLRLQVARRTVDMTPNSRGAMLEIPGVVTMGQGYRLDSERIENHYEIVEAVNFASGKHQVSAGTSVHSVRMESRIANRFAGIYIFPSMADFLAGRPDVYLQAFGNPRTSLNTLPIGLWLQDRWELTQGLSVEAGVRYDIQMMPEGIPVTKRNIAPRLGMAWRPGGGASFVLRAGFGLFYDRYPLAYLNDAIQKNGVNGFEVYAAGDNAARAFALAQGGTLDSPPAGFARSTYRAANDFAATYSRKLSIGAERSLGKVTTLTAEYSWVRGYHLPRTRNAALTLPPSYLLEQTALSAFQGASFSVNRRMSKEVAFLIGYNVGKTDDDGSDFDEQPLDPANIRRDWSRSRQHQLHRLSASGLFDLPAGEMGWLPKGLQDALENISVAPIFTIGSGRPLNALATTDLYRTGAYPISARPAGFERNPFLSPGIVNADLRVMKTFPFHENRSRLQVGLEAFNLANHTNAIRVSPYYSVNNQPLSTYRGIVETLNSRQLQFMIQFEY